MHYPIGKYRDTYRIVAQVSRYVSHHKLWYSQTSL